ncbi:metal-dependent hydrolase [Mycobacterium sp. CBMA293]|uniref:metal-dependent hydrolase n=2 Tax=Mycolicibacterium TaxID=1866885 RepID=UPI0012DC0382|nr:MULTISPECIES: metal-dependent hydrolase [unclassified Mycolicibacterium]MUL48702.1 metal-dependent hydrolase [Mycolicibacterium sp. CBMA 360]MUL60800.1 metal-dependent hydrolase [Mycolicibacterium sp. CBMA 335]MUL71813.1 metal-dependent hydrolase [Mycolicibacterium sp. CBMA 311]MUL95741.1 metal-dependent hydrolase [Mycolicibacterium sp. CBMA 230]MUM03517.1 metal-dependent hydrolase [Mycolicibacterium sp. CBMA 213]
MSAEPITSHGVAYPKVRRMRFQFGDPEPLKRHFVEGDIVFSHLVAVLSGSFPPGEESFIRSVRRFSDQITDPVLKKRVAGFIGQESVHGQEHRKLNTQLADMGYPLVRFLLFAPTSVRQKVVLRMEKMIPAKVHLAMTAAAEHYTAVLGARVLSSDEIQAIPGDPEVWHLLNWHAMEELEHKSVAFDVYRSVGGSERTRIAVMWFMYFLTIPVVTAAVALSILLDPTAWPRPITVLRQTYGVFRGPLVRGILGEIHEYLRPGFHPDDVPTDELLERWQRELFGADGELVGYVR